MENFYIFSGLIFIKTTKKSLPFIYKLQREKKKKIKTKINLLARTSSSMNQFSTVHSTSSKSLVPAFDRVYADAGY